MSQSVITSGQIAECSIKHSPNRCLELFRKQRKTETKQGETSTETKHVEYPANITRCSIFCLKSVSGTWPESQAHSFCYWIPPTLRKRRKLSAKKGSFTSILQTSLFHIKLELQFCISHKNLRLRLGRQSLKYSIIHKRKGEKRKE